MMHELVVPLPDLSLPVCLIATIICAFECTHCFHILESVLINCKWYVASASGYVYTDHEDAVTWLKVDAACMHALS